MEIFLCIFCCLSALLLPCLLCFYLLPSIKRVDKNNMIMQNLIERLRPLVGSKGWNYCILWTISEDQRFIEWMNCCCAGTEHPENNNGCGDHDQELLFPVSPVIPCRDTMFQHPKTHSCDLLSQLPISIPLESGFYAQTLISNQPSWLNSSSAKPSSVFESSFEEDVGTRVLVPLPGALIELFVAKQISEDPNVIDFIASQCNLSLDHHHQDSLIDPNFIIDVNVMSHAESQPMISQPPALSPATAFENLHLSYDAGTDRANGMPPRGGSDAFFEEEMHGQHVEEGSKEATRGGRSNSMSDCSDQIDDEDDGSKQRRKTKGPQCKNLVAERKRRKKLNERLYTLRSLVPKISKLDRASILGDAIEYVKDLKRQEKELQDELERHSETNNNDDIAKTNGKRNHVASSDNILCHDDAKFDHNKPLNGFHFEACGNDGVSRQYQDSEDVNDKAPQMEPQVEVAQIDGNEFFVKVFCEHKAGRFVRLMEALNSLALEVTNANVTTFRNLVSNVLKVEKKDSKMVVQADHLRDFLLELTRNPSRGLSDMSKDNGLININDYHHPNY